MGSEAREGASWREEPVPDDANDFSFAHLVRAGLAIILVVSLPLVLYVGSAGGTGLQAYQDALAAVVAFYFGASSEPR
jgi:hypothetical protein